MEAEVEAKVDYTALTKRQLLDRVFASGLCTNKSAANIKYYGKLSKADLCYQVSTHEHYKALIGTIRAGLRLSHLGHQHPSIDKPCESCGNQVGEWYAFTQPAIKRNGGTYYPNHYVMQADGTYVVNRAQGVYLYCMECASA